MAQLPDDCDPTHAPVATCPEFLEVPVDPTLCHWSVPYQMLDTMGSDDDEGDEVICRSSRAFGKGLSMVEISVKCADQCGNPAVNTCRTLIVPRDTTPPWITIRDNKRAIELEAGGESIWRNLAEFATIDYDDNCTSKHAVATGIVEVETSDYADELIEGAPGHFKGRRTDQEDDLFVFFADWHRILASVNTNIAGVDSRCYRMTWKAQDAVLNRSGVSVCVPVGDPADCSKFECDALVTSRKPDGCTAKVIRIDTPLDQDPSPGPNYEQDVGDALNALPRDMVIGWMCDNDDEDRDPACRRRIPSNRDLFDVHSVFSGPPYGYVRAELPQPIRNFSLCQALQTIHDTIDPLNPGAHIGRECSVSTLADPDDPPVVPEDWENWHLQRVLGPRYRAGPPYSGAMFPPFRRKVKIVLIDSGVDPRMAKNRDLVIVEDSVPDFMWKSSNLHAHGTTMALLLNQIAPEATIRSMRVLDSEGQGSTAVLAKAIERTLAEHDGDGPLVVNLSIGWPPELSKPRHVKDEDLTCDFIEGPVGAPILRMIQQGQAASTPEAPIVFVTPVGNRGDQDPKVYEDRFDVVTPDPPEDNTPAKWFYPAEWSRAIGVERNILAIGAVDSVGHRSRISLLGDESLLVAPGALVYVDSEHIDPSPPIECNSTPGDSHGVTMPTLATGTSVSAALVSGAIAYAQSLPTPSGDPLPFRALRALLYLSGKRFTRPSDDPVPPEVSHLSVCRLEWALTCDELVDCVMGIEQEFTPQAMSVCSDEAEDCWVGLGDICDLPEPWQAPDRPDRPEPPCATVDVPDNWDANPCDNLEPKETCITQMPDRFSLGEVAGQPGEPGCPDCRLVILGSGPWSGHWRLETGISPKISPNIDLDRAYLVVTDLSDSTNPRTVYSKLSDNEDNPWKRGNTVLATGRGLGDLVLKDDPVIKAEIVFRTWETAKLSTRDVSVLSVDIRR